MAVERFTSGTFSKALRFFPDAIWCDAGLRQGEHCFLLKFGHTISTCGILVRSSIRADGWSASTAEDSIRILLVHDSDNLDAPAFKLGRHHTTRTTGWQERMNAIIEEMVTLIKRAGRCPRCNTSLGIATAKTDQNDGRPFARCQECKFFEWLDEPRKVPQESQSPIKAASEPSKNRTAPEDEYEAAKDNAPKCRCDILSVVRRVGKPGPTQGQLFYVCRDSKCGFFEWVQKATPQVNDDGVDEELEQLRSEINGKKCPCGAMRLSAWRVRKPGQNHGRLFTKCAKCGAMEWKSEAKTPVQENPHAARMERIEKEAGDCRTSGKPLKCRVVGANGKPKNRGRLFLACGERGCDCFAFCDENTPGWVGGDADEEVVPPTTALIDAELEAARCFCPPCEQCQGERFVGRSAQAKTKDRLFVRCDKCQTFEWLTEASE